MRLSPFPAENDKRRQNHGHEEWNATHVCVSLGRTDEVGTHKVNRRRISGKPAPTVCQTAPIAAHQPSGGGGRSRTRMMVRWTAAARI